MIKRIIAGVLSASLCTSVVASGTFDNVIGSVPDAVSTTTESKTDTELRSTNSLGNYINEATNHIEQLKQLSNKNEDQSKKYEIAGVEFDSSTGNFRIISSQASDCTLEVDFFDEATNELITSEKIPVKAGHRIVTVGTIDSSLLSEYFIIKTFLIDNIGSPISSIRTKRTFTKQTQEIITADINDFDADRVVNFDEDETTNFIVLSDDTVKAEISQDMNQLVSADYDNNVFVLENADDSVRNIESGQYFYFQPNEEDIIAVAVDEVETEGSITTIRGNGDIDEMFDLVKFESVSDTSDAVVDNSETGIGYEYIENEDGTDGKISFDPEDVLSEINNSVSQYYSEDERETGTFTVSKKLAVTFNPDPNSNLSLTPAINTSFKFKYNFYSKRLYIDAEVELTSTQSIDISIKATFVNENDNTTLICPPSFADPVCFDLAEIVIYTQIPGLCVPVLLSINLNISGEMKISFGVTTVSGFSFNNEDFFDPDFEPYFDSATTDITVKVSGSVFIGFSIKAGAALLDDDVASFLITGTAGLQITGSVSTSIGTEIVSRNNIGNYTTCNLGTITGNTNILCCSELKNGDIKSFHACSTCIDGDVNFVVNFGLEAKITDLWKWTPTLASFSTKIDDWYLSFGRLSPECDPINPVSDPDWLSSRHENTLEWEWGECPHWAYLTEISVLIQKKYLDQNGRVTKTENVDNFNDLFYITLGNVQVSYWASTKKYPVYCLPGTYTASVTYDGKTYSTTFNVGNESKHADISGTIYIYPDGTTSSEADNNSEAPVAPPVVTTVTPNYPTITTRAPRPNPAPRIAESVKLGDNITGTIYSDGYMHVYGYGDMYDFKSAPFTKAGTVKQIFFEQKVKENKLGITSIGNNVFSGFSSLNSSTCDKEVDFTDNVFILPDNITRIGAYAFSGCSALKNIRFGNAVTSIDEYAFKDCSGLTGLVIPDSVTTIGTQIFNGCTSLAELTLPFAATKKSCTEVEGTVDKNDSVADMFLIHDWSWDNSKMDFADYAISKITIKGGYKIPSYAFSNMTTLKEIDLSGTNIKNIDDHAFFNCSSLATVKLSGELVSVGDYAYSNTGITALPDNGKIERIGNYAFADCTKLAFSTFPKSYTTIGSYAFRNCLGVKKLVVPPTVVSMGTQIFNGCTAMTELTLPYAATASSCALTTGAVDKHCSVADLFLVHDWSWENTDMNFTPSYNLTKITITGGEVVPMYAFSHMTCVKEIDLSNTEITAIGSYAFNDCTALEKVTFPDTLDAINEYAFSNCEAIPEFNLNDGLLTIGSRAFFNCKGITSIIIPETVTSMGMQIFNGCTKLEELQLPYAATQKTCADTNGTIDQHCSVADLFLIHDWSWENSEMDFTNYSIRKITITGGDKIPAYAFSHMNTLKELDFSNTSISAIGDYAFWNCVALDDIKMPDSVTTIGNYSYYGTPITKLPDNGNIRSVGNYAFAECKNFGNITIPKSYKSFGSHALMNCKGIIKLVIPPTVTSMGGQIFNGCTALKELTIPYAATSLSGARGNASVDQHMSVADLFLSQDWSWDNSNMDFTNYSIEKITVTGGSVVPQYAFSNMHNIKEIDLSATKITSFGSYAFNNCTNLTTLKLPASLKSIGEYAFNGCTSIPGFDFTDSLTTISSYAFKNCTSITSLEIPDSVTSMGPLMLNGCVSLETLTIPYAGTVKTCTNINGDINQHCSVADLFLSQDWSWDNSEMNFTPYSLSRIIVKGGERIPMYAFSGMNTIKEIDIASSTDLICDHAFNNCSSVVSFEIPESVKAIKEGAFTGDNGDVYIYNPACIISDKTFDENYSGTIHGYASSTAKDFADNNGYKFIPFDGDVVIGPKTLSMVKGDNYAIKSNYTNLDYTSSDEKIVTVDASGIISALEAGNAVVEVKASNGDKCTMSINVKAPVKTTATTTSGTGTSAPKQNASNTTTASSGSAKSSTTTTKTVTTTSKEASATTKIDSTSAKVSSTTAKAATTTSGAASSTTSTQAAEKPVAVQTVKLGDDITGTVYSDGTAYISGEGSMYDNQSSPFKDPESIEKVYMTGDISNIGDSTFADMSSLSSIVIPDSVESIGSNAFSGCTGLENVGYSGSEQDWNKIRIGEGNEDALDNVQFNVQPSVTEIPGLVVILLNGDANGDGKISKADGMLLARYVAGWDGIVIDLNSVDINGDGQISKADGMILSRYIAGWEGYDKYFS